MKKIKIYGVLLMAAMALGFQGCSDSDKSAIDWGEPRLTVTGMDTVKIESLNFTGSATTKMVGINTNKDWEVVSSDTSWLKVAPRAGYGYAYETRMSWTQISVLKNTGESRTGTITVKAGNMEQTVAVTQMGSDASDTFLKADEFIKKVKIGYNLGNTLESNHDITSPSVQSWFNPKTVYDWETCWGQTQTTQEIINVIAEKGFNLIRVPVTWFPHMDADGNVNADWMKRVQEVVDYVLNAGCYCIINVHHDASDPTTGRGDGGNWLVADIDQYAEDSPRFKKLWTQIANHFQNYDDRLLFEGVNEIIDETGNWGDPAKSSAYECVNKLQQDFVDAVRATGGNNTYRNLVINPYSAGHSLAKLAGYQVPVDQVNGHLLASVHSYDPYNFCNNNGQWNVDAFDSSGEKEVDDIFARVDKRFRQDLDIPYFFGEFGALDENKLMSERVKYAAYMRKKFDAYGTMGLWWMGLYSRSTDAKSKSIFLTWYEEEIADALLK